MLWVGLLVMFLAFFVYLVMAGAGVLLAGSVILRSALGGVVFGLLLAFYPYAASKGFGIVVFTHFAIFGCVVGLASQSVSRAREFLVAKSSTLEVVCLNVLAVAFGAPPDTSFGLFDQLSELSYALLVNPLGFWLPADLAWLKMLLSLWPSMLALWAAARGGQASRGFRLFLMWWVQLTAVVWLLPATFEMLANVGNVTRYFHVDLLLADIGLVRVLLTLVALHVSVWGARRDEQFELPEGVTAKAAFRSVMVDNMLVFSWPPWAYAASGFATYLLVNVAQHFLEPQMAVNAGFFGILGITSLISLSGVRTSEAAPAGAAPVLLVMTLLGCGLLVLRELPLLPRYVPNRNSQAAQTETPAPSPPKPEQPKPARPSPVPTLADTGAARSADLAIRRLLPGTPMACEIERADELRVRCASEAWTLAELPHPEQIPPPMELNPPSSLFSVEFQDFDAQCVELPVQWPRFEPDDVLLLVFLANASLPGQVGWVVGRRARCFDLRVERTANGNGELTVFLPYRDPDDPGDGRRMQKVVTLQRHPQSEAAIP